MNLNRLRLVSSVLTLTVGGVKITELTGHADHLTASCEMVCEPINKFISAAKIMVRKLPESDRNLLKLFEEVNFQNGQWHLKPSTKQKDSQENLQVMPLFFLDFDMTTLLNTQLSHLVGQLLEQNVKNFKKISHKLDRKAYLIAKSALIELREVNEKLRHFGYCDNIFLGNAHANTGLFHNGWLEYANIQKIIKAVMMEEKLEKGREVGTQEIRDWQNGIIRKKKYENSISSSIAEIVKLINGAKPSGFDIDIPNNIFSNNKLAKDSLLFNNNWSRPILNLSSKVSLKRLLKNIDNDKILGEGTIQQKNYKILIFLIRAYRRDCSEHHIMLSRIVESMKISRKGCTCGTRSNQIDHIKYIYNMMVNPEDNNLLLIKKSNQSENMVCGKGYKYKQGKNYDTSNNLQNTVESTLSTEIWKLLPDPISSDPLIGAENKGTIILKDQGEMCIPEGNLNNCPGRFPIKDCLPNPVLANMIDKFYRDRKNDVPCTCENGVADNSKPCEKGSPNECKICNPGYSLTRNNRCEEITNCTCENGVADHSKSCSKSYPNGCESCNPGYSLTWLTERCEKNFFFHCICPNGNAVSKSDCVHFKSVNCESCDIGYSLINSTCIANNCTCENGVGSVGYGCKIPGTAACDSCNDGFKLKGKGWLGKGIGKCVKSTGWFGWSKNEELLISNTTDASVMHVITEKISTKIETESTKALDLQETQSMDGKPVTIEEKLAQETTSEMSSDLSEIQNALEGKSGEIQIPDDLGSELGKLVELFISTQDTD